MVCCTRGSFEFAACSGNPSSAVSPLGPSAQIMPLTLRGVTIQPSGSDADAERSGSDTGCSAATVALVMPDAGGAPPECQTPNNVFSIGLTLLPNCAAASLS